MGKCGLFEGSDKAMCVGSAGQHGELGMSGWLFGISGLL